jgi:3-oxoacyl-[acyl-carrier-protein] synthase-3
MATITFNNIGISAISSSLPETVLEMDSLKSVYGKKEVAAIIKTTGIERSRIATEGETASDMCFRATSDLLDKERIDRNEIGGLVFVSQTTDYILPATSICLQDRLGLSKETVCLDIHYGCSGYIYGLFQAALWIHSGVCKKVLVLAGDTTSAMIHPKDKSLRMVFGDCGTATLVTIGEHPMGISIHSDGSGFDSLIVPAGGFRTPSSAETSQLRYDSDGNARTTNDLFMDGMAIFNFAISCVPKDINNIIETMGWTKESVDFYALHQANEFMVNYIRKKLKTTPEKAPTNVRDYGNTGPASIPLLFSDVCSKGGYRLDRVVMCGFGVGLSWGSIACNMSKTNFYKPVNQ